MSTPTHTPGPWTMWEEETRNGDYKIRAVGAVIGAVWKQPDGIGDANARLVCKAPIAPKLAEALHDCIVTLRTIAQGGHRETGEVTASAETLRHIASRALAKDCIRAPLAEWDKEA